MKSPKSSDTSTEIYLDHAATSHLDPAAAERMRALYAEGLGNAASIHKAGVRAAVVLEGARQSLALRLGARPDEIVFTSGGTESNNLALLGAAGFPDVRARHLIVSAIEHPSVMEPARYLREFGAGLTVIPVDSDARIDLGALENAVRPGGVVSVMHANNETGTLQDLAEIGRICKSAGAVFHCDASQSFGKVPVNVRECGIDLLTISAHKFHGPRGVGALFVREGMRLGGICRGAGQEKGLRPGTVPVELIAGMQAAFESFSPADARRIAEHSEILRELLQREFPDCSFNGHREFRVPTILNFSLGKDSKALLLELSKRGVFVSTGSACSSGKKLPSPVLLAMGRDENAALRGIRVSMGKSTTRDDIERFVHVLREAYERV